MIYKDYKIVNIFGVTMIYNFGYCEKIWKYIERSGILQVFSIEIVCSKVGFSLFDKILVKI